MKQVNSSELIETIFSYINQIAGERSTDNILRMLADMGRAIVYADRCSVWVLSKDKKKLWTKVAHGIDSIEVDADSGIVGDAVQNKKRLIINNVHEDARFNNIIEEQTGYVTKTMLVIPMFNREGVIIGAFQVINKLGENGIFTEEDLRHIMLASTYAAETIENSLLLEEVDETQKEVVFTMGAIGESRSKETGNHVKRVAQYSQTLALAYGLDEAQAQLLKDASPMHDIGKVAIPDAVLNKPGRFNEEERKIMDTHAQLGYEMLQHSERKLLKAASIVAYQHHEKWDGTGYPNGLAGEDIHIFGRITAVADVFDALGSDRCYKKAWEDERIFALFKEERGKHFDPKLVDLLFENLDTILAIRDHYKDEFDEV
ncbi:MAG TPA: HD domain-containing protein [Epsilonproteobacteria bacterium]|nr:HD domain-containing protein [Campylobacterota bacterium]